MQITAKDKKTLMVLGVVAILAIYFNFFLKPNMEEIKELRENVNEFNQIYEERSGFETRLITKDEQIEEIDKKFNELRRLFPSEFNNDELLVIVSNIAHNSGVYINTYSFNEREYASGSQSALNRTRAHITNPVILQSLERNGLHPNAKQPFMAESLADQGRGFIYRVGVTARGNYNQLKDFFYRIEAFKNKIGIKNVQLSTISLDEISAQFSLEFYGIEDKYYERKALDLNYWTPVETGIRTDIFRQYDGFQGTSVPQTSAGVVGLDITRFDFTSRVLPYGGDFAPQSVSLSIKSLTHSTNNSPIIFGDSKEDAKVEIYVEEKDGKFYAKYKTEFEAFPDSSYASVEEFTPITEDITLLISSTSRKAQNDNSTVTFNINNNTNRRFSVVIVNEDPSEPRVNISKLSQNIFVEYK